MDEVAATTVNCVLASAPATVIAIAFLCGEFPEEAAAHLNAINKIGNKNYFNAMLNTMLQQSWVNIMQYCNNKMFNK